MHDSMRAYHPTPCSRLAVPFQAIGALQGRVPAAQVPRPAARHRPAAPGLRRGGGTVGGGGGRTRVELATELRTASSHRHDRTACTAAAVVQYGAAAAAQAAPAGARVRGRGAAAAPAAPAVVTRAALRAAGAPAASPQLRRPHQRLSARRPGAQPGSGFRAWAFVGHGVRAGAAARAAACPKVGAG